MDQNTLNIIFYKTSSINYEYALNIAKKFNNCLQKDKMTEITILKNEMFEKIFHIENLCSFIALWKHTEIIFNEKKCNFDNLSEVIRCAKKYHKSEAKETHCYQYEDKKEGWHCKFLTDTPRYIPANNYDYIRKPSHWFDYGHFEDMYWVINKEHIKQKLRDEAEKKLLELCPHFGYQNIEKILNSFPEKIDIENNKDWCANEQEIDTGYSLEIKKVGILPRRIVDELNNKNTSVYSVSTVGGIPVVKAINQENQNANRYIPNVKFSEIGGLGDTIKIIREVIELPILQPKIFGHLGITPHKGILLFGPPGCGKTLIAKAIANEINAHFINIKGPELFSKWLGESEENLRKIFEEARLHEPSIIFFDEFDAIAQKRSGDAIHESKFVNQLLTLMDGVEEYSNVRIIASTNRPELLDEAIQRPGRFDYRIEIKKPTIEGCKEILKIYTKRMPISDDINLDLFADELMGLSGSDIHFITTEAGYNCLRRNMGGLEFLSLNKSPIDLQDFIVISEDFFCALTKLKSPERTQGNPIP